MMIRKIGRPSRIARRIASFKDDAQSSLYMVSSRSVGRAASKRLSIRRASTVCASRGAVRDNQVRSIRTIRHIFHSRFYQPTTITPDNINSALKHCNEESSQPSADAEIGHRTRFRADRQHDASRCRQYPRQPGDLSGNLCLYCGPYRDRRTITAIERLMLFHYERLTV